MFEPRNRWCAHQDCELNPRCPQHNPRQWRGFVVYYRYDMAERPRIAVSTNPVKERVRLDIDGNVIDPITKRIIMTAAEFNAS